MTPGDTACALGTPQHSPPAGGRAQVQQRPGLLQELELAVELEELEGGAGAESCGRESTGHRLPGLWVTGVLGPQPPGPAAPHRSPWPGGRTCPSGSCPVCSSCPWWRREGPRAGPGAAGGTGLRETPGMSGADGRDGLVSPAASPGGPSGPRRPLRCSHPGPASLPRPHGYDRDRDPGPGPGDTCPKRFPSVPRASRPTSALPRRHLGSGASPLPWPGRPTAGRRRRNGNNPPSGARLSLALASLVIHRMEKSGLTVPIWRQ